MITETILKKFTNNIKEELITETIHIPNGTKSVKVITHEDLDGVCSAITMVDQLKKQGVKNIQIEFAQYSDKDLDKDMASSGKNQRTIMTDFARVPRVKIWDLISTIFFKEEDAEKNKAKIVSMINNNIPAFKHMKTKQLVQLLKTTFPRANTLKMGENYRKDYKGNLIPSAGWKTGTANKGAKTMDALLQALQAYAGRLLKDNPKNPNEKPTEKITVNNIKTYEIPLADVDMTIDHHGTEEDGLTKARSGEIGVKSPSECSDAVAKYNPDSWSKDDLEAIDMVDSAGYKPSELINTTTLEKNFSGKDKKRNLAMIINTVLGQCLKNNEPAAKWLVLNTAPNLINLYTNMQKTFKFNAVQLKLMDCIKDGKFDEVKALAAQLPKEMQNKWWAKGYASSDDKQLKGVKKMATFDNIKDKAEAELKKVTSGKRTPEEEKEFKQLKSNRKKTPEQKARQEELESKEGNFTSKNDFSIQHGNASRYTGSVISFGGRRNPFVAKKFSMGMIQVSKSPLYDGEVDFFKVAPHVMEDVENYMREHKFNERTINAVMTKMKNESGGHETIYNLQGFDEIKPFKKASYGEEQAVKRAEELAKKKFGEGREHMKERNAYINAIIPNMKAKVNADKDAYNPANGVKDAAIESFIKWTNKLYPTDETKFKPEMKNLDKKFEVR